MDVAVTASFNHIGNAWPAEILPRLSGISLLSYHVTFDGEVLTLAMVWAVATDHDAPLVQVPTSVPLIKSVGLPVPSVTFNQ